MAQILIRNLDDSLVESLKQRAERNHRSLQGEVAQILTRAARLDPKEFAKRTEEILRQMGPVGEFDATESIRQDRER
jgi:hypothetical protein